jgi:hypothetical protein
MSFSSSFTDYARRRGAPAAAGIAAAAVLLGAAAAARAQTTPLTASDFTLTLARVDASGNDVPLDANALMSFFSAARCACPANLVMNLTINSDSLANLTSADTLEAQVMVGPSCGDANTTVSCPSFGTTLTLNASSTAGSTTLSTASLFSTIEPGVACSALQATSSRIWAIVRQNGTLLASQPSLAISLGGTGPAVPTAVTTQSADSGLLVSWTASGDATTIQGYQVLCAPSPSAPAAPAYDTSCAASMPSSTGPFTPLASFLCSALVPVGTTQVRVHGLTNGTAYQVAVIAIGNDGSPSAPSDAAAGTPQPTVGFDDLYKASGGTAQGCSVAGAPRGHGLWSQLAAAALVLLLALRSSRRGRGRRWPRGRRGAGAALAVLAALSLAQAGAARADDDDDNPVDEQGGFRPSLFPDQPIGRPAAHVKPSPRNWYLELRFGPYHPDVDSEFESRGSPARPFDQLFGSSQRLMSQLELDRELAHRGGTWALGVSAGIYRAAASSLAADLVTRTGDQTELRLVPLSVSAVFRADTLHERTHFPIIPYAKLGLDCTLWSISDTAKTSSMTGATYGWHAAAGISLDLSFLDPDDAHTMDMETGVNQFALFFEGARYAVDGFGSGSVLHVGDTTWMAGLMLEL